MSKGFELDFKMWVCDYTVYFRILHQSENIKNGQHGRVLNFNASNGLAIRSRHELEIFKNSIYLRGANVKCDTPYMTSTLTFNSRDDAKAYVEKAMDALSEFIGVGFPYNDGYKDSHKVYVFRGVGR